MTDPSLLRALVLIPLALYVGASARVCWLYARVWQRMRASGRGARLTPLHVALASASLLVIEMALAWALIASFRQPITLFGAIRTGMYGLGSLGMIAALMVIARVQSRRVRICRQEAHVTVEQVETIDVQEPGGDR